MHVHTLKTWTKVTTPPETYTSWLNQLMRYTWVLCNTCTDYKTTGQRDTTQLSERKLARVIYNYQPGHNTMFILNCDLDLDPTLVKPRHCMSSHHTWHLCKVICKSHHWFKRYGGDTKYSDTMFNLRLWPLPWTDLGQT